MLDEEQHYVQAAQEHRIDVEEIRGEDCLGLGLQARAVHTIGERPWQTRLAALLR
ncbi:MAG TPA: hypothetical protein VKD26_10475 [Streptosporangiaceae bacterium]|nr:hypothetical protein [Streptosporangiaceae bacterium]